MQHRTGQIEDAAEIAGLAGFEAVCSLGCNSLGINLAWFSHQRQGPQTGQSLANGGHRRLAAKPGTSRGANFVPQHLIDRGQPDSR